MNDTERINFYEEILRKSGQRVSFANLPCGVFPGAGGADERLTFLTIREAIDAHIEFNRTHGTEPASFGAFDP